MKVALIQISAGPDKTKNIAKAIAFVKRGIHHKAHFLLLPELFPYRGNTDKKFILKYVAEKIPGPSTIPFLDIAKKAKVYILAGSVYEKDSRNKKVYNTSVLIDRRGTFVAKYRKKHLFNAVVGRKTVRESRYLSPGSKGVTAKIDAFKAGLSICYDLRFPALYHNYTQKGCQILLIPSAFTKKTGEAHWKALLRARAIENLCYVLAPNQTGKGAQGICSYGHSMMINPWGQVLAEGSLNREQVIYADIDMNTVKRVRVYLPPIRKLL